MAKTYDAEFIREITPEFERFMAYAEEVRWSPKDIPYDKIDHDKLTMQDLFSVYVTLHIENYSDVYRGLLVKYYADMPLIKEFVMNWEREEENHARTLETYLTTLGYSLEELRKSYGMVNRNDFSIGNVDQTGINIFVFFQELFTRESYKKILKNTSEPVLTQILKRVIRDEERHYRFYKQSLELRLRLDRKDTLKQARRVIQSFRMPQTMYRQNAMTDQLVMYQGFSTKDILNIARPIGQMFPKSYLLLSPYAWGHLKHTLKQKLRLQKIPREDVEHVETVMSNLQRILQQRTTAVA